MLFELMIYYIDITIKVQEQDGQAQNRKRGRYRSGSSF